MLLPNNYSLDTGAIHNTINSKFSQVDWKHKIKNHPTPRVQRAIWDPITMLIAIRRHVRIGSLHVKVLYEIFGNLVVKILLRTPFIDQHIREVFPGEQIRAPWNSEQIIVLTKPARIGQQSQAGTDPNDNVAVQNSRAIDLKPSAETRVMVSSPITRLSFLEPAHPGNQ